MENNKALTISSWIIVVFIAGVVLKLARPVLFPFFLAIFFYFVLSPVLDFLSRLKIPRAISIVFIVVVFFLVLYLLSVLFYSSGKSFASELPKYGQKIDAILASFKGQVEGLGIDWSRLAAVDSLDVNRIASFLLSSLGTFFSFLSNLFLIFIFLLFMLAGRGNLKGKIEKSFDSTRASKIGAVIENIDRQVQKYLAIKTVISIASGLLTTFILMAFGLDFAVVFGFLTFILNYIPNIGSFISKTFPVLFAAFQFDSLWPAFWILLILVGTDLVLGNIIEPKLLGASLGLSPLAVLFALLFWGWLWGIPGMILAVPIVAVLKIVCNNIPSLQFLAAFMSK